MACPCQMIGYAELQSALGLSGIRPLEDLLISDCFYSGIIAGKLDQRAQCVQVDSTQEACCACRARAACRPRLLLHESSGWDLGTACASTPCSACRAYSVLQVALCLLQQQSCCQCSPWVCMEGCAWNGVLGARACCHQRLGHAWASSDC